jgi:hypothetical protein
MPDKPIGRGYIFALKKEIRFPGRETAGYPGGIV